MIIDGGRPRIASTSPTVVTRWSAEFSLLMA
jgi:hypothetical protein